MSKKRTLHYVLSTHWDREWYLPFQVFRHRLVQFMDDILARMASGSLEGPFTGDGQAILIEDYLEIRPERRSELQRLVKEGRAVFGPWYVLPDEFLVSGESLIRNIRMGREVVREFGGIPSDAGFVCDLFGHNSQMPQILAGFGVRGAIVWRGVDGHGKSAWIAWEGADGTVMPTYRFGTHGYCDYTYKVRHSPEANVVFDAAKARAELKDFIAEELGRTGPDGPGLIFDGGDHLFLDPAHYEIIKEVIADSGDDYRVVHSSLDSFLEEFIASGKPTRTLRGELREPARWPIRQDGQFLIPGVGSSRVWIKQENAACESLLCQWAEPFAALAALSLGVEYPQGFLRAAWKWLLQNHPHDSICGCSVDQVHEDMKFRFSQCRQIAETVTAESLGRLVAAVPGDLGGREVRVAVFNPLPLPRDEVIEFDVDVPADWPEFTEFFGYEQKPAFRLFDTEGKEISYQRLGTTRDRTRRQLRRGSYPQTQKVHRVRIAARLALPPVGFAVLKMAGQPAPTKADPFPQFAVAPTRPPAAPGLRTGHTRVENEFLSVEIQPNGALALTDKTTRQTYRDLNLFEDDADIGDGWNHGPTVNRRNVLSGTNGAQVELLCDTPLVATFVVRQSLGLPGEYDFRNHGRSGLRVPLLIETLVTLRADANFVDLETRVTNNAGDHRLRAVFPTEAKSDTWLADTAFDVVERPVALRADNHLYRELEVDMKPQRTWAAVFDPARGLAVVTAGGQLESGVFDRPDRPLVFTLYRATRRTVMTDNEPDGQLPGHNLCFRCRLVPLAGAPDRAVLFRHALDLSGGTKTVHLDASDLAFQRSLPGGTAPSSSSLLEINGPAVLTSARLSGDALEVRSFNPETRPVLAAVRPATTLGLSLPVPVDFESRTTGRPPLTPDGDAGTQLGPKKISTLSFQRNKSH